MRLPSNSKNGNVELVADSSIPRPAASKDENRSSRNCAFLRPGRSGRHVDDLGGQKRGRPLEKFQAGAGEVPEILIAGYERYAVVNAGLSDQAISKSGFVPTCDDRHPKKPGAFPESRRRIE